MDTDKENFPHGAHLEGYTKTSTRSPATATLAAANGSSAQAALGPALAFPAEDPDEDRDVLASDGKTLRSKRSVLFYPSASVAAKFNQQPFSRSAAKRDSILALGSIGYLQHLYTKQGIANRSRPITKGAMQLAIGPAGEAMFGNDSASSPSSRAPARGGRAVPGQIEEEDEMELLDLPPSPKAAENVRPRFLDVARPLEADAQALRALLATDLHRLSEAWQLSGWLAADAEVETLRTLLADGTDGSEPKRDGKLKGAADIVKLVDATTKAIRSVRSYVLALPQRSKIPTTSPIEPSGRDRYKRQSSFSGVSRPGQTGTAVPTRTSELLHADTSVEEAPAQPNTLAVPFITMPLARRLSTERATEDSDDLSTLRRAALEMLASLKEMEETHRVEALGSVDEAHNPDASTASAEGRDDTASTHADTAETLVGYLYRQDLQLSDLAKERAALQQYLKTVDAVLSGSISVHERRGSAGSGAASAEGPRELQTATLSAPVLKTAEGASDAGDARGAWTATGMSTGERLWRFLTDHCTSDTARLERVEATQGDLDELLSLVCDGYLLCRAFNEVVRRSAKPWGYISSREMHDLEAEEAVLAHKEAQRIRHALEGEAPTFQTRSARSTASHDDAINEVEVRAATSNRPGWTFRRTENLRVWAAALRLRYHIQTTATRAPAKPAAPGPTYGSLGMGKLALHGRRVASESAAPTEPLAHQTISRTIDFDPAKVARRDPGWQAMLTTLLEAWIAAVAQDQPTST